MKKKHTFFRHIYLLFVQFANTRNARFLSLLYYIKICKKKKKKIFIFFFNFSIITLCENNDNCHWRRFLFELLILTHHLYTKSRGVFLFLLSTTHVKIILAFFSLCLQLYCLSYTISRNAKKILLLFDFCKDGLYSTFRKVCITRFHKIVITIL